MSKRRIHFVGLLSNADSSILKLKLKHGFIIKAMPQTDGVRFIRKLDVDDSQTLEHELFANLRCINDKEEQIYLITRSFLVNHQNYQNETTRFIGAFIDRYLDPVIRLIRLFKVGNLCMPKKYFYYRRDRQLIPYINMWSGLRINYEPFTVDGQELSSLQKFINKYNLPFNKSFIELAMENFELSYVTNIRNLSFLSLMMSMEGLFDQSEELGISHRIARNCAVLLGDNIYKSKIIYSEVKKLYHKRSRIIHSGRTDIISNDDLSKLRFYVRESIKKVHLTNKNKNDLLEFLNTCGFDKVFK